MRGWIHVLVALLAIGIISGCFTQPAPKQPGADLVLTQSVNQTSVEIGAKITFTITVTNRGPNNASGIVFGESLPSALKIVSCSCSAGSTTDGSFCEVDQLGSGKSAVATVVATAITDPTQSQAMFTSKAFISEFIAFDPDRKNNSASVVVQIVPQSRGQAQ